MLPRTLAVFVVSMLGGFGCKKPSQSVAVQRDDDAQPLSPIDAANEASSTAVTDAGGPPVIPTIACDESPDVRWNVEPTHAFSCSPLRAATPGTWADEKGALVTPLELTVAPGTQFTLDLSVKDAKGSKHAGKLRQELRGLPGDARVDASTQTLQWAVKGKDGDVLVGSVATLVKLATGEKCVRQSMVVRLKDDDATRANQAAHKVRLEQFYRKLDCSWASQGPDLAENSVNDVRMEKALREQLACGAPLVTVRMKDVDGDGLRDALVRFDVRRNPDAAKDPAAPKWEMGIGTQVFLRKGDDFVRAAEVAGEPHEADDGTTLFLDTDEVEHARCPPHPYRSTGGPSCPVTSIDVSRWVSGHVEKVTTVEGAANPGSAGDFLICPRSAVEVVNDAKGRVVGFRTSGKTLSWKGTSTAPP